MKRLLALAALALGAAAAPIAAQAAPEGRAAHFQRADDRGGGRQVPLSRVLAMIAARTPGRHLNTSMGDAGGGRPAYYVQWQTSDGRVVVYVVDAETGQIIGMR